MLTRRTLLAGATAIAAAPALAQTIPAPITPYGHYGLWIRSSLNDLVRGSVKLDAVVLVVPPTEWRNRPLPPATVESMAELYQPHYADSPPLAQLANAYGRLLDQGCILAADDKRWAALDDNHPTFFMAPWVVIPTPDRFALVTYTMRGEPLGHGLQQGRHPLLG